MPEHGTRAMESIADAGELPQAKQYGATSARSTKIQNISDNDKSSRFYFTHPKFTPVQVEFQPVLTFLYRFSARKADIWDDLESIHA